MTRILLLGERSYAATGLYNTLKNNGYQVECFSRGEESKDDDFIKGDAFNLSKNKYLANEYDIVLNFIIIKNEPIETNIQFIKEVHQLCQDKKVKNLLHISSISCYSQNDPIVDENSEIEKNPSIKGQYAAVKIEIDKFLLNLKKNYKLSFIRPGFIYSKDTDLSGNISGIGIRLLGRTVVLMGNKKTPLTLIRRDVMHEAILKIIQNGCKESVYLMFENNNSTKQSFLLKLGFKRIIPLNKFLLLSLARVLRIIRFFNTSKFEQVKSLFRTTEYTCYQTEFNLDISFIPNSYCIIGAGTYGSYIANKIRETYPDAYITIFEVGNETIKSEDEIGYKTNIKKDPYIGTAKGRFFGYGGASAKWGGQLLTFTDNDFQSPNGFLKDIISADQKYRELVFNRFNIGNEFIEKRINDKLFIKTGYWLGYFQRNLFKFFKVKNINNLKIESNSRVIKFLRSDQKITGFEYLQNNSKKLRRFDKYFLCAGAFESFRILLNSGLISKNYVSFSDHLSRKMFAVKGSTKIGKDDFGFKVRGTSLITKRIIGEINNISFYFNPKFNDNFPFFQNLKTLLFKREISFKLIKDILLDVPSLVAFLWSIFIKRRIHVYKNEWLVDIDIENPSVKSKISLSDDVDAFGERALDLEFEKGDDISETYDKIRMLIKQYLDDNKVNYREIEDDIHVTKTEDTYHPYGMLGEINSIEDYFNMFENMLVVNTGILPRAGGINTAAAVFPVVEEYFSRNSLN